MSELKQAINEMRNMREAYNDLAKEINEDKKAIIHEMQLAGLDISSDASMAEVAERMREYTLVVRGNTEFVEGTYIRSLGDAIFDGLMSKELVSIETELPIAINQEWMSQENNIFLKRFSAPNAESITASYLNGCTGLEYLNCAAWMKGLSTPAFVSSLVYVNVGGLTATLAMPNVKYMRVGNSGIRVSSYQIPLLRHFGSNGVQLEYYVSQVPTTPSLYDCRLYQQVNADLNMKMYGNTIDLTSTSLCNADEWDDASQPQFANNGEKLLWYFKHHFLYMDDGTPAFADMTGESSPTLTLNTTVKNFVMADDEVAAYFTARNWTIA